MSSQSLNVGWLKVDKLKSMAARRFARFCIQDFEENQQAVDSIPAADNELYKEAVQLVIDRIEKAQAGNK